MTTKTKKMMKMTNMNKKIWKNMTHLTTGEGAIANHPHP